MKTALSLLLAACVSASASAETILLPGLTALAYGQNRSLWNTEVRVTNLSGQAKRFAIVDWIGTEGWRPKEWVVAPNASLSIGGFDIFRTPYAVLPPFQLPAFGAAVAEADEGLIVQIAILTGIEGRGPVMDDFACEPWNGGSVSGAAEFGPCGRIGACNTGAGPIFEATTFLAPASRILLPWLHTSEDRRTNIVLVNPDPVPAHVTITVFAADGTPQASRELTLAAHSLLQENDVFSGPFAAVRAHNEALPAAAARAVVQSDTRLHALAYVISNLNNTVSVSLPRLAP